METGVFNSKDFCFTFAFILHLFHPETVILNVWPQKGNTGYSQSLVFNISFSMN